MAGRFAGSGGIASGGAAWPKACGAITLSPALRGTGERSLCDPSRGGARRGCCLGFLRCGHGRPLGGGPASGRPATRAEGVLWRRVSWVVRCGLGGPLGGGPASAVGRAEGVLGPGRPDCWAPSARSLAGRSVHPARPDGVPRRVPEAKQSEPIPRRPGDCVVGRVASGGGRCSTLSPARRGTGERRRPSRGVPGEGGVWGF